MSFANLTALQFLTLFSAGTVFLVLLYLLDRSRQRRVVATLRFWTQAETPVEARRWRIYQPLSLLLQLLALLFLLLAVAQLQTGGAEDRSRDHIIVLDTSAWMAASAGTDETWMEQARAEALAYLRVLPPADRVMILHAGSIVTPATSFETDRRLLEEAITAATPGVGGLNLTEALGIAAESLRLHGRRPGEVAFIGPGHSIEAEAGEPPDIENLRFIEVRSEVENVGIERAGLSHSTEAPNEWEVYVAVRNHSSIRRNAQVAAEFAASPAVFRRLSLDAGQEQQISFPLRTRAAGLLEIRILDEDGFAPDNSAVLEVPARSLGRVVVHSNRPDLFRPLLAASPLVEAVYRRPTEDSDAGADILILDSCALPAGADAAGILWIRPPEGSAPVTAVHAANNVAVERWSIDHPVAAGLQTPDLVIPQAQILAPGDGDIPLAFGAEGPVAIARETGDPSQKQVILGFHPAEAGLRNALAAPLLFANILRWMRPDIFRRWELNATSAGLVTVPVPPDLKPEQVRVADERDQELPFTLDSGLVRFYTGRAGAVTVQAGDHRIVCSLGLPPSPQSRWEPPSSVRRGVPAPGTGPAGNTDWWPWLALAAGLCLFAEWMMFGRSRRLAADGLSWNRVENAR